MDEGIPTTKHVPAQMYRVESGSATNYDDGTKMDNEQDYLDLYCQLNPVDKSVRLRVFQPKPDQSYGKIDSGHLDASDSQRGGTLKRSNQPIVSVEQGFRTPSGDISGNPLDVSEGYTTERRDPTQNAGPRNFQFVIQIDVGEGQYSVDQAADMTGSIGADTSVTPAPSEISLTPKREPVPPRNTQLTPSCTIVFRQFRAEHNCLASDSKRNELLLFNSSLKKLIILQHEINGQCDRRFYIQWPATLSPDVSDITYWAQNGHYILSTTATNSLYLFDRANQFFFPVQLADRSVVSRVHCYERFVYCILDDKYLVRYRWDEQGTSLTNMTRIDLSGAHHRSSHRIGRLLDVTCDSQHLVVVYAAGNDNDSVRLACLDPGTLRVKEDFELDAAGHINGKCIRIESTETFVSEPYRSKSKNDITQKGPKETPGRFLYLNGEHRLVKYIDLTRHGDERVTTITSLPTKATNACLLFDDRLVIMHDDPYSLSIYNKESVPS